MSHHDEIKGLIRTAVEERTNADRLWRAGTERLAHSLRRGHDAGIGIAELSRTAGITRQAVYDFIAADEEAELAGPPPRRPRRGRRAGA